MAGYASFVDEFMEKHILSAYTTDWADIPHRDRTQPQEDRRRSLLRKACAGGMAIRKDGGEEDVPFHVVENHIDGGLHDRSNGVEGEDT